MSSLLGLLLGPFSLFEGWVHGIEARILRARPPGLAGRTLHLVHIALLARRRCVADHVGDRAAALAFSTLLSMLPLLLIALAALAWLGYTGDQLGEVESWLFTSFVPDVAASLAELLHRSALELARASRALGAMGVLLLLLAGSNLLGTLGRAFNRIWGEAGLLSTLGRIAGFWLTVVGGPLLVAASLYLTAQAERFPGAASLLAVAVEQAGFGLVSFAAYVFLPGKRVRLRPALLGAAASGLLFELLKRGFAAYVRRAFVASTVLAGLGVLPIFLLWMWFVWIAFLFGAECAWCAQDFDAACERHAPEPAGKT